MSGTPAQYPSGRSTPAEDAACGAADLLMAAAAAGVRLEARSGGRLWCSNPPRLTPELRDGLAAHRPAVLALLSGKVAGDALPPTPAQPAEPGDGETPRQIPPSWADPFIIPAKGWSCSCCRGRRWWAEATNAQGWRCRTCYPPPPDTDCWSR